MKMPAASPFQNSIDDDIDKTLRQKIQAAGLAS